MGKYFDLRTKRPSAKSHTCDRSECKRIREANKSITFTSVCATETKRIQERKQKSIGYICMKNTHSTKATTNQNEQKKKQQRRTTNEKEK